MKVNKIRKSEVKKAIAGSGGYMSEIARRLNVDWATARKLVEMHNLRHDVDLEDEKLNDIAELKLMKNVEAGDNTAIIFRLKTKAKNRGYIEQTNHRMQIENEQARVGKLFEDFERSIEDEIQ